MSSLWENIDKRRILILSTIAGVTFLLDQASKFIVLARMDLGQTIPLIEGIFHLTLIENPGAAFGILPHQRAFFLITTAAAIIFLVFVSLFLSKKNYSINVALALLIGGALGNFADRLRTGCVVDFIDFRIWPVFNLADVAIVFGLIFFAINLRHLKL